MRPPWKRCLVGLALSAILSFGFAPTPEVHARLQGQESRNPLSPAYAHGMVTGPECGTYTWAADLTKGRTNSVVVHVHHTELSPTGCARTYDYTNYIGADKARELTKEETDWQMGECDRAGRLDTLHLFDYYWHQQIDDSTVQVHCDRYHGPD